MILDDVTKSKLVKVNFNSILISFDIVSINGTLNVGLAVTEEAELLINTVDELRATLIDCMEVTINQLKGGNF